MIPEPPVRVTLDVTCDSETVVEKWYVDFLIGRGFNVAAPNGNWESVGDFKKRLGISYTLVAKKIKPRDDRPNVLIQRGSKNRQIVAILSNPAFDAFCVANK
jgi:hypothetical protein